MRKLSEKEKVARAFRMLTCTDCAKNNVMCTKHFWEHLKNMPSAKQWAKDTGFNSAFYYR